MAAVREALAARYLFVAWTRFTCVNLLLEGPVLRNTIKNRTERHEAS
jgi:hypothetical protein